MTLGVMRPSPNAFSAWTIRRLSGNLKPASFRAVCSKSELGPTHGVRTVRPIGEIDRTRGDLRRQTE